MFDWTTIAKILEISWINILLSGDNAVVIALACRALPDRQRRMGILLGAGVAVVLRIVFAIVVTTLMALPYLRLVGALLLFWIAVKLVTEETGEADIAASESLWNAVKTIAIADAVMSLDNVIAVAAVAKGDYWLFIFGLAMSIPIVVVGAQLLTQLLNRFPILVWAGAALLGWVAGEMILGDPVVLDMLQKSLPGWVETVALDVNPAGRQPIHTVEYTMAGIGAAIVVVLGWLIKKRHAEAPAH
jgi:YjbE family integral membrane protein